MKNVASGLQFCVQLKRLHITGNPVAIKEDNRWEYIRHFDPGVYSLKYVTATVYVEPKFDVFVSVYRLLLLDDLPCLDMIDDVQREIPVENKLSIEAEIVSLCSQCHTAFTELDAEFGAVLK